MYSFARTLIKNNEILRSNVRRKYEIWDLNTKHRYEKDSLKNAKKRDKDNLNFIQSEEFYQEFENTKLQRLLMILCVIIFVIGLIVLR